VKNQEEKRLGSFTRWTENRYNAGLYFDYFHFYNGCKWSNSSSDTKNIIENQKKVV